MAAGFNAGSIFATLRMNVSDWRKNAISVLSDTKRIKAEFKAMADQAKQSAQSFAVWTGAAAAGITFLLHSLVDVNGAVEDARIRLEVLTGSVETGRQVFQDAARIAALLPLEFREIMQTATALSSVMTGGAEQIISFIPIIADLSKAAGLSVQETTSNFIRMWSAGIASADLFKERGVDAILGFQKGVEYSVEETRRKVIESFLAIDSRWRGLANKMADTWAGQISMIQDKWFLLWQKIGETGAFKSLKDALTQVNNFLSANQERVEDLIAKHGELITKITMGAVAFVASTAALGALGVTATAASSGLRFVYSVVRLLLVGVPSLVASVGAMQVGFSGVAQIGPKAFRALLNPAGVVLTAIFAIVNSVLILRAAFKQNLYHMGDDLKWLSDQFQGFVDWLMGIWRDSVTYLSGLWSDFMAFLGRTVGQTNYGRSLAKNFEYDKQVAGDLIEETKGLFSDLWATLKTQTAQDVDDFKAFLKAQMPGVFSLYDDMAQAWEDAKNSAGGGDISQFINEDALNAAADALGRAAGGAGGKAVKEKLTEAQKAFEAAKERGEDLYLTLNKVEGAYRSLTKSIMDLTAAGRLDASTAGAVGAELTKLVGDLSKEQIQGILDRASEAGMAMADQVTQGFQTRLAEIAAQESTDRGENDFLGLRPDMAALDAMAQRIQDLKAAGRLDDVTGENNVLAQAYWWSLKDSGTEAINALVERAKALSPELAADLEEIVEAQAKLAKADQLEKAAQVTEQFASALGSLPGLFKEAAKVATTASRVLQAAAAAASGDWLSFATNALSAVGEALGLIGEKSKETASRMDQVFAALQDALESVMDRLTDLIVEFFKEGTASVKEFLDYILEETLRALVSTTITEPLQQGIESLFKSEPVQAKAYPTQAPAGSGDPIGKVEIIDQRTAAPPVQLQSTRGADGLRNIRVYIVDTMKSALASGELDNSMGTNFQAQRAPIVR